MATPGFGIAPPLPRRVYTERSDCNPVTALDRVTVISNRMIHEQCNTMVLRDLDGSQLEPARESGCSDYPKNIDVDFQPCPQVLECEAGLPRESANARGVLPVQVTWRASEGQGRLDADDHSAVHPGERTSGSKNSTGRDIGKVFAEWVEPARAGHGIA